MNPPKAITTQCAAGCIRPSSEVGAIWMGLVWPLDLGGENTERERLYISGCIILGVSS